MVRSKLEWGLLNSGNSESWTIGLRIDGTRYWHFNDALDWDMFRTFLKLKNTAQFGWDSAIVMRPKFVSLRLVGLLYGEI